MTTEPTDDPVIHFVDSMAISTSLSSLGTGRVFGYGDELLVTPEVREANKDRFGRSWLDWLDTSADAYTVGGREVCRRGPWPQGKSKLLPGSWAWEEARRRAVTEALSIENPEDRRAARQKVELDYPLGITSRTLQTTGEGR